MDLPDHREWEGTRSFHQFELETEKSLGYTGPSAPLTVDPQKPSLYYRKEDSAENRKSVDGNVLKPVNIF
jgi:hypothetical protein